MSITSANYPDWPKALTEMSERGGEVSRLLAECYRRYDELKASWTGERYNIVANAFNNVIGDINNLEKQMTEEITSAVDYCGKQIANTDWSSMGTFSMANIVQTEDISMSDTSRFLFDTGAAEDALGTIRGIYSSVQNEISNYVTARNKIQWEGSAGQSFANTFDELKAKLDSSFENVFNTFQQQIDSAKEDVIRTEQANMFE